MREGWDDEQLLAALRESLTAREAVPSWFVETGKNAYAWHNIDAELAQLTYDSSHDRNRAAVMRSEAASIRALTFTSARLSIELEVIEGRLLGQIIPPQAGTLETHTTTGNALDMLAQRFDKQCPDGLNYSTVGDDLYETAVRSL